MDKRDYGSGSILERAPGTFLLRWYEDDPLTGERRRRTETFHGGKKDAARRLAEVVSARPRDEAGDQITLAACLARWRAVARHELSTARNYDLGERTISARMLAMPISTIRAAAIAELVAAVEREHGVHRARLVHATISGALTQARRWEWIAHNPAHRVQPPSAPRREPSQPNAEQVRALLAAVADRPQPHAWILVSADVGGRRSEVLGLRWSLVDLARRQVRIVQALDPVDAHEKDTRTRKRRTVALSGLTVEALETWRSRLDAVSDRAGGVLVVDPFVFTDDITRATPWRPDVGTKRFAGCENASVGSTASVSTISATSSPPNCSPKASTSASPQAVSDTPMTTTSDT